MGATLQETMAELDALAADQTSGGPPPPPPPGSPQRPPFLGSGTAKPKGEVSPPKAAPPKPQGGGVLAGIADTAKNFGKFIAEGNPTTDQGRKVIADRTKAAAAGFVRAPAVLAGGLLDTSADAGRLQGDNIQAQFARLPAGRMKSALDVLAAGEAVVDPHQLLNNARQVLTGGASLKDVLSARQSVGQIGSPQVNEATAQLVSNIALFLDGGAGMNVGKELLTGGLRAVPKVALQVGKSSIAQGAISGVTADASGTGAERVKTRGAAAATAAAANMVAEPLLGVLGASIKARVSAGKKVTTATPEEALTEHVDRALATGRTQEARFQARDAEVAAQKDPANAGAAAVDGQVSDGQAVVEAAGVKPVDAPPGPVEVPAGERAADAVAGHLRDPTGPSATDEFATLQAERRQIGLELAKARSAGDVRREGSLKAAMLATEDRMATIHHKEINPAYLDAMNALETAGVKVDLNYETNPMRPDGRISVAPEIKKAADEAGVGRFLAADNEAVGEQVIFKETDAAGGHRVVGMMSKDDLDHFIQNVEMNREDPLFTPDQLRDHPQGQWKLANVGATYDVGPVLAALSDHVPTKSVLSDADLMAQVKVHADAIGFDLGDMVAWATNNAKDIDQVPVVAATYRTLHARAGSIIDGLVREVPEDFHDLPDDSPFVRDLVKSIHQMVTLHGAFAEFKSEAGRTLRASGLPDLDTYMANFGKVPEGHLTPTDPLDGLPVFPRTKTEVDQWMSAWKMTEGDPIARTKFLEGLTFMRGKWWTMRNSFANFFTASIISGPATILRNLVGPTFVSGVQMLERTSGAAALAVNPLVSAEVRAEARLVMGTAPRAYFETMGHFWDSFMAAKRALVEGHSVLDGGASELYNLRSRPVPQALIDAKVAADGGVTGGIPYHIANIVNFFPTQVHRLHGTTQEFAQRLAYLGEVRASAYLEAAEQGLKGQNLRDYVVKRVTESTDEVTWAGIDKANLKKSQRTTFVKPVGDDNSPIVRSMAKAVAAARDNVPEWRYVLPIFSVPANALGETVRRIPVVGQLFKESSEELAGKYGAVRQAEAYGRFMAGTSFMGVGMAWARSGRLTGAGPSDPRDRKIWELQGRQPYSFRVGGTDAEGGYWVNYNKFDLVGPLMAIPALFADKSVHTQGDQQNMVYTAISAIAQYTKDQAALEGISQLMGLGEDAAKDKGILERLGEQTARGFVPNFLNQIGRNNFDPLKREVNNPLESIMNSLPGLSQRLDPQRNLLGEPTEKIQNVGLNVFPLAITKANTWDKDPVIDELDRFVNQTGYVPGLKAPILPGGHQDMREVELEDGRSLYDAVMRYRTDTRDDEGMTLRESLAALIVSPEYAAAVDADGGQAETTSGDVSRGRLLQQTFQRFDKLAVSAVANDSAVAARWLAVGDVKRLNDAALRDKTDAEVAADPTGLLAPLGIDINDFEEKVKAR